MRSLAVGDQASEKMQGEERKRVLWLLVGVLGHTVACGGPTRPAGDAPREPIPLPQPTASIEMPSFSQVSMGDTHACAIGKDDGRVLCWGSNYFGESNAPDKAFAKISVGDGRSCGILQESGQLLCWGDNWFDPGNPIPQDVKYSELSIHSLHLCALRAENGQVDCWGNDMHRQVSDAPKEGSFHSISTGHSHSCAIDSKTDKIFCWGGVEGKLPELELKALDNQCAIAKESGFSQCWGNEELAAGIPWETSMLALSQRGDTACGIRVRDGRAECWNSEEIALPDEAQAAVFHDLDIGGSAICGTRRGSRHLECWGEAKTQLLGAPNQKKYKAVEVGLLMATCALSEESGEISCWGKDSNLLKEAEGVEAQSISLGEALCAIREGDAGLACWGDSDREVVSNHPRRATFSSIHVHREVACGMHANGKLQCWGELASPVPKESFKQIELGHGYVCGIRKSDSGIQCWGAVDGKKQYSSAPKNGQYIALSVGDDHACAIDSLGKILCWGSDEMGKVSKHPKVGKFAKIAAGVAHTCAESTEGRLVCWGGKSPERLEAQSEFSLQSLSAGLEQSCGIRSGTQSLHCWGDEQFNPFFPASH